MLRGFTRSAILMLAPALASALPAQAQAAGVGAGAIVAAVNLSPGFAFPPAPIADQTFTFVSPTITGGVASTGGAGTFVASASLGASSIVENEAVGVGNIPDITAAGVIAVGTGGNVSVTCGGGVYVRVGLLVAMADVSCDVIIGGASGSGAVLVPVSLLIPNQTPPATVSSASFSGVLGFNFAAA